MGYPQKTIDITWEQDTLHVYHLADAHEGSQGADDPYLDEVVAKIAADPYALVMLGGDMIEAIAPTDRRWDPNELSKPINAEHLGNPFYTQALRIVKRLQPIADKVRVVIPGNHEYTAARRFYIEPTTIIAERLGAMLTGLSTMNAWVRVLWRQSNRTRATLSMYMTHGNGGGELAGSLALKLERLLYRKDADLIFVGHHHRPMFQHKATEFVGRKGHILHRNRIGIIGYPLCTGHHYAARKNLDPSPRGYTVAEVSFVLHKPPQIDIRFCTKP